MESSYVEGDQMLSGATSKFTITLYRDNVKLGKYELKASGNIMN